MEYKRELRVCSSQKLTPITNVGRVTEGKVPRDESGQRQGLRQHHKTTHTKASPETHIREKVSEHFTSRTKIDEHRKTTCMI